MTRETAQGHPGVSIISGERLLQLVAPENEPRSAVS